MMASIGQTKELHIIVMTGVFLLGIFVYPLAMGNLVNKEQILPEPAKAVHVLYLA